MIQRFLPVLCLLLPLLVAEKLRSSPPSQRPNTSEDTPPVRLRVEPYSLQVTKLPRDQFGFGVRPWSGKEITGWLANSGTVLIMRVQFNAPVLNIDTDASRLRFTDDKGTDLTRDSDLKPRKRLFDNNKVLLFERGTGGSGELTVHGLSTPVTGATKVIVDGTLITEVGLGESQVDEKTIDLTATRFPLAAGPVQMSALLTRMDRLQVSFHEVGPGFDQIQWIGPDGTSHPNDEAFVPVKNHSINYTIPKSEKPRLTVRVTYYPKVERKAFPIRVEAGLGF